MMRELKWVSLAAAGLGSCTATVGEGEQPAIGRALAEVTNNAAYRLRGVHSGLCLDVEDGSSADGANVRLWECNGSTAHQFRFEATEDGFYRIRNIASDKCLDVWQRSTESGANIAQWTCHDAPNQRFSVLDATSGGAVRLISQLSGKALDAWEWGTRSGTDVVQWDAHGGDNQSFVMTVVASGSNGPSAAANPASGGSGCGQGNPDFVIAGASGSYHLNGDSAGGDYFDAILRAVRRASPGQRVSVLASGSIGENSLRLPSGITFEVCGTMNTGSVGGRGAIEAIGAQDVSIPYLNLTGSPYFGLRFADVHNLHLGQINLRLSGGLGVRFERDLPGSTEVTMDRVVVSGTGNHGVETWNVDGLTIGEVIARDVGYAGLLLNNTRNAHIGLVDGANTASGTGYATLRFANNNGEIDGAYPTNILVDRVVSRGGGRGFFCVSNSGGAHIGHVDLANNGNNAILIENCHNVTIGGGVIDGGGEVRLAARSEFPNNSDITISNLNVSGTNVRESPCGVNTAWNDLRMQNGSANTCQ